MRFIEWLRKWTWKMPGVLISLASVAVPVTTAGDTGLSQPPGVPQTRIAPSETVIARWDFETAGDVEGWRAGHDIGSLRAAKGCLEVAVTGRDPYLYPPPVQAPLDGCVLRVRVRSDVTANMQVYWATQDHPEYNPQRMISRLIRAPQYQFPCENKSGFITLTFALGSLADAGRILTGLRLDPTDGPARARVEIDWVELVRLAQRLEVTAAWSSHRVDPRETAHLRLSLRPVQGRAEGPFYEAVLPATAPQRVRVESKKLVLESGPTRLDQPGTHVSRTILRSPEGKSACDMEASIIACEADVPPVEPVLRAETVALDLVRSATGSGYGAARWRIRTPDNVWRTAGWLLPLARLIVRTGTGTVVQREPEFRIAERTERLVRLHATVEAEGLWTVEVEFSLAAGGQVDPINVHARLTCPPGGRLLAFAGPMVRVDGDGARERILLQRYALFGGIEFLAPGWRSSSARAVGERFADRWSPHPFKVSLPVMAIEADGLTRAVMWRPGGENREATSDALPTATFASPNFLDGQPNHLMCLSLPGIGTYREENEAYARTPLPAQASRSLHLAYKLAAGADLPVAQTARLWYELFSPPPPPSQPYPSDTLYAMILRNYGQTNYWADEGGWRNHWFHTDKTGYRADIAATLIAHAAATGDRTWIERTGLTDQSVIEAAGTLASRLRANRQVRNNIQTMRPDGTWAFINTQRVRKLARRFTNGRHNGLGEDGSTSLGTCATHALPILHYAALSGDEASIEAGVRALAAMTRFRVPRGAQTWEVHQDIPDIRAATLAVEAYHLGYQLTGDRQWLDEAGYWAWTGVPFLYSWHVPIENTPGFLFASYDRDASERSYIPLRKVYQSGRPQVTPYGSLPVLGTTFYTINWFGVLVQWCGLEWAEKVIELDRDRPDRLLRYIADGVVRSGQQQMSDMLPWIGLYPDSWRLRSNLAYPALIYPGLILRCMQAQEVLPRDSVPWTRVLHDATRNRRWHVSGWGRPIELAEPRLANPWQATVAFLPGQPNELILANVDRPTQLRIESQRLAKRTPDASGESEVGWYYDPKHRAIVARFIQPHKLTRIEVRW